MHHEESSDGETLADLVKGYVRATGPFRKNGSIEEEGCLGRRASGVEDFLRGACETKYETPRFENVPMQPTGPGLIDSV